MLFFGVDKQSFSSNHSFEADNAHNCLFSVLLFLKINKNSYFRVK